MQIKIVVQDMPVLDNLNFTIETDIPNPIKSTKQSEKGSIGSLGCDLTDQLLLLGGENLIPFV